MALVRAQNLAFRYATLEGAPPADYALPACSFEVQEGAFCLVTGPTGCGKSTFLRSCKPELAPQGAYEGSLEVCGVKLVDKTRCYNTMEQRHSAMEIGFVAQDPDAQIVCDTVWHELAFSLENLGWEEGAMRRRVAEVAHFFGIAPWVQRRTSELSDGQKQVVNLAAVLALRPRLMLLDEPTAQLDPIARTRFLSLLARVNRELGITVMMATHLPEEAQSFATQTIELSHIGRAALLEDLMALRTHQQIVRAKSEDAEVIIEARDVFARYSPHDPWVLRGLDLCIKKGLIHAVVGSNGSGKTTVLRVLAGDIPIRRGKVKNPLRNTQALLPQNPKSLFATDSVAQELSEWKESGVFDTAEHKALAQVGLKDFGEPKGSVEFEEAKKLEEFEKRHPFDLSAGQQQLLALAKIMMARPQLLLLDEPTKGLDAHSCAYVVRTVRKAAQAGVTVVLTTHDLDFAAAVADEATLLFDGQAACTQAVPAFFEENLIWRPHRTSRLFGALL